METNLDVVADKAYHSIEVEADLVALTVRTDISEPDRGRLHSRGYAAARHSVHESCRRIMGRAGKCSGTDAANCWNGPSLMPVKR